MQRIQLMSQIKGGREDRFIEELNKRRDELALFLKAGGVTVFSLFRHERLLFIYMEAGQSFQTFKWDESLKELLEAWPGDKELRYSVPMADIFHYNRPVQGIPWREGPAEKRIGSLARLNPDMVSSYIFYHYQLQEERPGAGSKTYIIGYYDRYIFAYTELPKVITEAPPGLLHTNHSPAEWQQAMLPHFEQWDLPGLAENKRNWLVMEELFHVFVD